MEAIFPDAFGPSALNNTCPLLASNPACAKAKLSASANVSTVPGGISSTDELLMAAIKAAKESYTPYSARRSGVALRTRSGAIYAAGAFESVAFNPTVQPVIAALVALIVGGGAKAGPNWASPITEAVLAEGPAEAGKRAGPSYAAHTAGVLHSLAPNASLQIVALG
jgi:cytidine deaminase